MAFAAVGTVIYMLISYGPINMWWHPFLGHHVNLSAENIRAIDLDHDESHKVDEWIRESIRGSWRRTNVKTYQFLRKSDAAMFKLAWG